MVGTQPRLVRLGLLQILLKLLHERAECFVVLFSQPIVLRLKFVDTTLKSLYLSVVGGLVDREGQPEDGGDCSQDGE